MRQGGSGLAQATRGPSQGGTGKARGASGSAGLGLCICGPSRLRLQEAAFLALSSSCQLCWGVHSMALHCLPSPPGGFSCINSGVYASCWHVGIANPLCPDQASE